MMYLHAMYVLGHVCVYRSRVPPGRWSPSKRLTISDRVLWTKKRLTISDWVWAVGPNISASAASQIGTIQRKSGKQRKRGKRQVRPRYLWRAASHGLTLCSVDFFCMRIRRLRTCTSSISLLDFVRFSCCALVVIESTRQQGHRKKTPSAECRTSDRFLSGAGAHRLTLLAGQRLTLLVQRDTAETHEYIERTCFPTGKLCVPITHTETYSGGRGGHPPRHST